MKICENKENDFLYFKNTSTSPVVVDDFSPSELTASSSPSSVSCEAFSGSFCWSDVDAPSYSIEK